MAIKHSITLSTTEPNNEVGVIKIRQADEQTQTLEVQITENGVPKSYQGLAVYFCAKLGQTAGLGIIEQKLKLEEMTDPANGKLEYTMRAEDWQILGRQKGYFSFRKMKNEHEFIEQFTTRDFTFDVIKSVFSEGVKEVKKDGSTYVWTIEELIRLFKEYVESGKTDWEEFVEQNREILESVDPSGTVLTELIDARKPFGGEAFPTIGARLDNFGETIEEMYGEIADGVQSITMPENISTIKTKSPKLVIKSAVNDKLNVVQWNGVRYVVYELDAAAGDSSQNSVGNSWDLIRLKKAHLAGDAYVAKKNHESVIGDLTILYAPAHRNTIEDYAIYKHGDESPTNFLSASGDGFGLGCYGISSTTQASEVSWNVAVGTNGKCNMLLFETTTSSADADILVNGEVVRKIDSTKFALGTNLTYKIIEFEIPTRVNITTTVKVTLRNNDKTGKRLYFSCLNFMPLKNYDGRDIDFYKVFTTSLAWINHAGASDYAIFDKDLQKWCGSYHGGETRESARLTWSSGTSWYPPTMWDTGRTNLRNISDVPVGWYITPTLKLQQLTNINDKGKMLSILDWDTDGTLQMNFGFFNGNIVAETFYTALTTTHVNFNYVRYPNYETLASDGSNLYLSGSEGYVIQSDIAKGISLGQRFTLFGNRYIPDVNKRKGWILNHPTYYKKLYYGFADGYTDGVLIKSLQFRKALDFTND